MWAVEYRPETDIMAEITAQVAKMTVRYAGYKR
jgi:hypothetical protein